MHDETHELALPGCSLTSLAHYLKALGILRLVAEQPDSQARGWWQDALFHLRSRLDLEDLLGFFLREYHPTPLVAPWNGGSGFYPNDNKAAFEPIGASDAPRLGQYAQTVSTCRGLLQDLGITESPGDTEKADLLMQCRARLPDTAVAWLDAAYVLTNDKPAFPPLLGTGGNDGRLEFTNNFMQRVVAVMDAETGAPTGDSARWLEAALFDVPTPLPSGKGTAVGQFLPGAAGGANAAADFDGDSLNNPWDYILMLEGAVVLAGSVTRRLGAGGRQALSYPFTVRTADVGYGTAGEGDRSRDSNRGEIWLPVWERPAVHAEVRALFAEGRATVGRRRARDGVDFARAVAALGVDRGMAAFERFGFLKRNGRSFIAMPLERWRVPARPAAVTTLLDELDPWLLPLEWAAGRDTTPAGIRRALRRIKAAMMEVCRSPEDAQRWQEVLAALGAAEAALVHSPRTTAAARLKPLPPLSPRWLAVCDDRSPEFRLALALASLRGVGTVGPLRANMAPLTFDAKRPQFNTARMDDPFVVWGHADLCANMAAALERRCLEASRENLPALPLRGTRPAGLDDIGAFIYGGVDERRLEDLLWGLNAVRLDAEPPAPPRESTTAVLPAAYNLLKLVHLPAPLQRAPGAEPVHVRYDPEITRLACAERVSEAVAAAAHRLRVSGLPLMVGALSEAPDLAPRIAAALLFPVSDHAAQALADRVLLPAAQEALA